jgi:hypothetical protein
VPTVSFTARGWVSRELVEAVEREGGGLFGIRVGSFYSVRLVEEVLGLEMGKGVVRVSMVHYNTGEFTPGYLSVLGCVRGSGLMCVVDEVKGLIAVLEKVLAQRK